MPKFLLIDDDEMVMRSLRRVAQTRLPKGWEVAYTTDPVAGLAQILSDHDIELCMIDLLMKGMHGDEIAERAIAQRPELKWKIILCSGAIYSRDEEEHLFVNIGCLRLDKPIDLERFEDLVLVATIR